MIRSIICISALLLIAAAYGQTPGTAEIKTFRASVVKIDITPGEPKYLSGYNERKSTGVHDHIYHRIVALDDGVTQFFLVSTEIAVVSPIEYDHVADKLKKRLGIDPQNFWWSTTHTHSAPEVGPFGLEKIFLGDRYGHEYDAEYTEYVEEELINGIKEAREKLSPARLSVGWGYSQANINRRAKDIDGVAFLGMDPDGPVDRRIGLLKIEKDNGQTLALIANYPIHGTVLGSKNLEISGDAPGIVADYVEEKIGAPLVFINGAAGNLAPIYSGANLNRLGPFRVMLGDKIIEAYQKMPASANKISLSTGSLMVETPRKADLDWPEDFVKYTRTTSSGVHLVRIPLHFLKINNDIAIWSAPLELFCEISNEIRDQSPFPYTFYFGYTNGWLGYLLTESEYNYKGYEPGVSPYTPHAERDLKEATVSYLQGELKNKGIAHNK